MADYIIRNEAAKVLCMACGNAACDPFECSFYKSMEDIPAADVRLVVRGKWVRGNENRTSPIKDSYICSVCGEKTLSGFCGNPAKTNFCPNCGADMAVNDRHYGEEGSDHG